MVDPRIEKALRARLESMSPAWPAVWDGDGGEPPDLATSWLRVGFVSTVLRGDRLLGTHSEWNGTLQISIRATTRAEASTMLTAVLAHFSKGLALTEAGMRIVLDQGTPFGGYADAGRWIVPFRIAFRSDPIAP